MLEEQSQEYTSPFNVNNQCYFCGIPFRLDSYASNCEHSCIYCFVRSAEKTSHSRKGKGEFLQVPDPQDLKRTLILALDTDSPREDINIEWLRRRVPIHWGGMSDPFQPCEKKYQVSKQWMQYLSYYKYPTVISTKGILLERPEYLKLLKMGNYAVQCTLIMSDDIVLRQIEPGAPLASDRINMLKRLADAGIWTAVRVQPMIPGSPVEERIEEHIELLHKAGVKHILAEGYKVQNRNEDCAKTLKKLFPAHAKNYQYNDVKVEGFETLLPTWRKWRYTKRMIKACHEFGMTYGAADNDLRDTGDTICCCGIDNIPGFENFWRYQSSQAAWIAKEKGFVELSDMQQFWTGEKKMSLHNDIIRLKHKRENGSSNSTLKFAIDHFWETGGPNSPDMMFSMKRETKGMKLIYKRIDPAKTLETMDTEQFTMF